MKALFSKMNRRRKAFLSIIAVFFALVVAYSLLSSYSVYRPIPFNNAAMSQAAKWVQLNRNASLEGAISLPPSLASVSATGKAYVRNDGIIFFPSWMGRKTLLPQPFESTEDYDIEGYGFSTMLLPTMESEPAGSTKFFIGIDLSDPAHSAANGGDGPQMAVESRIEKSWYEITSFS